MVNILNPVEVYDLKKEYFETPQEVIFKNIHVKVCPMPSDIPLLEANYYDESHDIFSVIFRNSGEIKQETVDHTLTFLTDAKNGYFAGIRISGIKEKNIQGVNLTIEKKTEDLLAELKRGLDSLKTEDLLNALKEYNLNTRKLNFVKNLIGMELSNSTI